MTAEFVRLAARRRVVDTASPQHGGSSISPRSARLRNATRAPWVSVTPALLLWLCGGDRAAPIAHVLCAPAPVANSGFGDAATFALEQIPVQSALRQPYNHTATIAALPNGELLVAWGAGARELAADTAIY